MPSELVAFRILTTMVLVGSIYACGLLVADLIRGCVRMRDRFEDWLWDGYDDVPVELPGNDGQWYRDMLA